ncbi:Bug family tripartite tricarboxylate transporter substrate binding protein [Metabacillus endolithicus]|uniref:Bug family tripartite tricarboxylate transporter substrate binding protein n=1 Tax=Metabacillus endolithicus TaxID=1535204 RepID=A0ABW5C3P1_9BACI|nr:tripartite tricarboxylate transporter substrate binding protein [Metabacillus endolithicus]UPG62502.1 tripartite tricarboxylate transporter substrate binding protein [Metabacillus endolithicus]
MKKLLSIVLLGLLMVILGACSGESASSNGSEDKEQTTNHSNYPEKPITIVAPSGAGGGLDTTSRALAKILDQTELISETITVENKPGGGQVVGTVEFANKEVGNDYKLLLTSTPFILNNLKKEGNSPISYRDITPLAQLVTENAVLAVSADSKYKDLTSLMEDLKANPSNITFAGGSGPGSYDHLNIVYPAMKAEVDVKSIKYVSYDGGGEALTALLGGNADVVSSDVASVYEYQKAGKVRILGVSSGERLPGEFEAIPTYKEQGIDVELTNWRGIFGPKDMSADAKKYWEEQIEALVTTEDWQNELNSLGFQDGYLNSEDFIKQIEKEEVMYKEILTTLGMQK